MHDSIKYVVRVVYENYSILQHFIKNYSATSLLRLQKQVRGSKFPKEACPQTPLGEVYSTHFVTNDWSPSPNKKILYETLQCAKIYLFHYRTPSKQFWSQTRQPPIPSSYTSVGCWSGTMVWILASLLADISLLTMLHPPVTLPVSTAHNQTGVMSFTGWRQVQVYVCTCTVCVKSINDCAVQYLKGTWKVFSSTWWGYAMVLYLL